MALQQRYARSREHIVNSRDTVGAGGSHFVTSAVEACVEHLIIMPAEGLNDLAASDVP